MLLCASVGLVLLATGAWALPHPSSLVRAQERAAAPAATRAVEAPATSGPAPTAPGTGAGPAPGKASGDPTSKASSRPASPATTVKVPAKGPGTYRTAEVSVPSTTGRGRLIRFDVRVEKGLDLDPDTVARALEKTLDDKRSWRSTGTVHFSLVPAGEDADLHAYLVTPGTTDRLCAPLLTGGEVSCRSGSKVVLNAKRWVRGAKPYGEDPGDIASYRHYLANHEFGHALGHGHVGCPRQGRPAPVMLQQTKGLQGCTANPWPSVTQG